MPKAEEFPKTELLSMEKEVTGMYLSGHPMSPYAEVYNAGASPRALMRLRAAPPGNPTNIKTSSMWTFWPLWKA